MATGNKRHIRNECGCASNAIKYLSADKCSDSFPLLNFYLFKTAPLVPPNLR